MGPVVAKLETLIEALTIKPQNASTIVSKEYDGVFKFGNFKLEEFSKILPDYDSISHSEIAKLVKDYTQKVLDSKALGNFEETKYVQPLSRELIKRLLDISFTKEEVNYERERPVSCVYLNKPYTGKTDHAIVPASREAAILVWEDKNMNLDFSKNGERYSDLCQVAVEIYAEVDKFNYKYGYKPKSFCGILTNGTKWFLVAYHLNLGIVQWRHCNEIVTVDGKGKFRKDGVRDVAIMLRLALGSARSHHKEVERCGITTSPHIYDDTVDDDDNEKDGDTETIDALGNSLTGTMRIFPGTKSAGGGSKSAGNSRGSTGNQKSHNHALLLTKDHLALVRSHDKENRYGNTMPWRLKQSVNSGTTFTEMGSTSDEFL